MLYTGTDISIKQFTMGAFETACVHGGHGHFQEETNVTLIQAPHT
jgi:hypothetical protein